MKNIKFFLVATLAMVALAFPGGLLAADGKALYYKLQCNACHGQDGKGILCTVRKKTGKYSKRCRKGDVKRAFQIYPKLAGQQSIYAFNQIKDILSGKRTNAQSRAMYDTIIKGNLLEKSGVKISELKAVTDWLAKVK